MEIKKKKTLFSVIFLVTVFLVIATTSFCKKNTLRDAIKEGNLEVVKLCVKEAGGLPKYVDVGNKISPLYAAIMYGHFNIVKYFASNGADVNEKVEVSSVLYESPLCLAIIMSSLDIIKYLILNLARINLFDINDAKTGEVKDYLYKIVKIQNLALTDKKLKAEVSKAIKSRDKDLLPYLFIVSLNKIVDKINKSKKSLVSFSGTLIHDFYKKMEKAQNRKEVAGIIAKELELKPGSINFSSTFGEFLRNVLKAIIDSGHSIAPKAKKSLEKLGLYKWKDFEKRMEFVIEKTF